MHFTLTRKICAGERDLAVIDKNDFCQQYRYRKTEKTKNRSERPSPEDGVENEEHDEQRNEDEKPDPLFESGHVVSGVDGLYESEDPVRIHSDRNLGSCPYAQNEEKGKDEGDG